MTYKFPLHVTHIDLHINGLFSVERVDWEPVTYLKYMYFDLSHNNPFFQCNIAITNFLVSHTCEIRFNDVIGQSTIRMYSYAEILKHS